MVLVLRLHFQKKYCSIECAKKFRKCNSTSHTNVECTCIICEKNYWLPNSQACYSKTCSRKCHHISQSGNKIERTVQKCEHCNIEFEQIKSAKIKRKYCSAECFNQAQKTEKVKFNCEICNSQFEVKQSRAISRKPRFCSRNCQFIAQSNGSQKIHMNGRYGKRVDLGDDVFRSSFEADYARFCRYMGFQYQYQSKTFDYIDDTIKRRYTPDFYHPDLIVTLKLNQ